MIIFTNKFVLKDYRKILRKRSTPAEIHLWKFLKGKQLNGRKFRRQHSVGYYILDFYCPQEKLAIELDGAHHFTEEGRKRDEERTRYLNELNIRVIRFENEQVFEKIEFVLEEIRKGFTANGSS